MSAPRASPTVQGPTLNALPRVDAEHIARVTKALADPTRLQIVALIREAERGEACVCDLTSPLGFRQPTVSHHLKVLVDAGLLTCEKRGAWRWYSLCRGGALRWQEELLTVLGTRPADERPRA